MNNLTKICEGIYCAGVRDDAEIHHDGLTLQRFMDIFYIYRDVDELSPGEVEALCRARANHPSCFEGGANKEVRQVFKQFIDSFRPANLLEVGAGTNPIFSNAEVACGGIGYVQSDADPLNASSENIFSSTRGALQYPAGHFDLAIAIFVLHFKFYEVQITELNRCLGQSGLFLANVYRRGPDSRAALLDDFKRCGFLCCLVDDPHHLCQEHQYLLATKDDRSLKSAVQLFMSTLADIDTER